MQNILIRDVSFVKEKRDELTKDLRKLEFVRSELHPNFSWRDARGDERLEYSYIINAISNLKTQINALEFILNADSNIMDYTKPSYRYNFTKEGLHEKAKWHFDNRKAKRAKEKEEFEKFASCKCHCNCLC